MKGREGKGEGSVRGSAVKEPREFDEGELRRLARGRGNNPSWRRTPRGI